MENLTKIEITKTELRSLMFWASIGIAKSRGGTYSRTAKKYLRESYKVMPTHIEYRCKNVEFGTLLKQ